MAGKTSRSHLSRAGGLLRLALVASLVFGMGGCSESKPPPDRSRYYRMKVGLTYKGQPLDINFVAGCGVHIGHDISGGSIHEIAGMTDLFRGVRMPEGHAVVINSYPDFEDPNFNPCDGDTTSGGQIPKDWLPFIVWFEHDDEFAHGIGYMTQDAYENKNARFGFRYASIEHATKAEFETFRKTGAPNLLPPHQTDWMTGGPTDPSYLDEKAVPDSVRRDPKSGWWKTDGRVCNGVIRTALKGAEQAILHESWPASHPDYWTDIDLSRHQASKILQRHPKIYKTYVPLTRLGARDPSRSQVFPVALSWAVSRVNAATPPVEEADVLISDGREHLGQVFCDVLNGAIAGAVLTKPFSKFGCEARIDGARLPWTYPGHCTDMEIAPFFYRDQYIIATIPAFRS